MFRHNIPLKAALGYLIVAIILITTVILIYSSTRSLMNIRASLQEYTDKQEHADSATAQLLKDEQYSLQQLHQMLERPGESRALLKKIKDLTNGNDSVVLTPQATEAHHVKSTTIEIATSRKGFFHRLADLFRRPRPDTVNVRRDSSVASVDTVAQPTNVSNQVVGILNEANQKERHLGYERQRELVKELNDMRDLTSYIVQHQTEKMKTLSRNGSDLLQQSLRKALQERQCLIIQIIILACIAVVTSVILIWHIWKDTKQEQAYQEKLEKANNEIKQIMEQRERLLLTITHDIKAPAASITGFTDILKDYIPSDKGRSLLGNIHDSATHLSRLVAELLDYHQLENGLMEVHNDVFSPSALAVQCMMGARPQADKKGLTLSADTTGCATAKCCGDSFRIRQIIDNLLSNAVKYTDKGSISLMIAINNHHIIISVQDSGKGISPSEQDAIFRPFKRLDNAQGTEGTGLGLSIVTRLVNLLRGTIALRSEVGKGTVFTITLPIDIAASSGEDDAQQQEKSTVRNYHNHHLLLLDDDPLQLKLLQEQIRQAAGSQWTVTACNHVSDALAKIHEQQPALMFMDIEMPEISGIDFIRHIDHHDMTVIAMTAHDESIIPTLREAGFDDCLFKPVNAESLAKVLEVAHNSQEKVKGSLTDDEEIRQTLHAELSDICRLLSAATAQTPPDRQSIAQAAHRLLPLAKMVGLHHIDSIEVLSPEKIETMTEIDLTKNIAIITKEIKDTEKKL